MNKQNSAQIGFHFLDSYASLPDIFYTKLEPQVFQHARMSKLNISLGQKLGLDTKVLQTQEGLQNLLGHNLPQSASLLAQAYAGHQFGHFTMLGDGRALLLGEQITPLGECLDIQLKGSGRTPYSRGGDGLASIGPMFREYIMSEAMHALGIPTTRTLAVIETGEKIYRETQQRGAILVRVAKSHLRVGTFEYCAAWGNHEQLKALADYAIERHYPHCKENINPYCKLLEEVIDAQASLIVKWELVGFIHGVMNTDNMTISGETIDYGPCAFMDAYNPKTVFSSIDRYGRYAYANQAPIAKWNLAKFAEALLPIIDFNQEKAVQLATDVLNSFDEKYRTYWLNGMANKLGICKCKEGDGALIKELLDLMEKTKADYTNTFFSLTRGEKQEGLETWYEKWEKRITDSQSKEEAISLMKKSNPVVIPRNYWVEKVLKDIVEENDFKSLEKFLREITTPYNLSEGKKEWMELPLSSGEGYQTFCGT
jgi:uncharacterized protein YdiU (UPF0061 family)